LNNISVFETNFLIFEPVSSGDVDFIYQLRSNRKDNFLKKIPKAKKIQIDYLNQYQQKFYNNEEIYYKIIEKKNLSKVGLVRITNLKDIERIGWESLIIKSESEPTTGLDACLSIYSLTFDILKKKYLGPWIVTKENEKMMKIHHYMNIVDILKENENNFILEVKKEKYLRQKKAFNNVKLGIINSYYE